MLQKLFKKVKNEVAVLTKPSYSVTEIHRAFDESTDQILAEAKRILSEKSDLEDKASRLVKAGFVKTKEVSENFETVKKRKQFRALVPLIEEYAIHYPNNKFITEDVVRSLCTKYNLFLGSCHNYIGSIPEKNLTEIENFIVKDEHIEYEEYNEWFFSRMPLSRLSNFISDEEGYKAKKPALSICAPEKDFDMRGMEKRGHMIAPKDPIVLQPVKGGYLIVTKWGIEGEDQELVNEKMN